MSCANGSQPIPDGFDTPTSKGPVDLTFECLVPGYEDNPSLPNCLNACFKPATQALDPSSGCVRANDTYVDRISPLVSQRRVR